MLDTCHDCGVRVPDGRAGCQQLFDDVLAREFGDYRYAREHRLMVDTYSLQHPDEYMKSGKSFAAHLTGMYAALELDDTAAVNRAVQRWLNGPGAVQRPRNVPGNRGELTIAWVHAASSPEDHVARVKEWAQSTWSAWSAFHELARQWIVEAGGRAG